MFLLPAFLAKFAGHDVTVNKSIWGPMYDGSRQCSLSPQETRLREQISTQVMSKRKAQRIVSEAAHLQVWPTRIQFIEALAALSSLHPGEMHRKLEGSKTTVVKMLHSLASSEKVEWLFNSPWGSFACVWRRRASRSVFATSSMANPRRVWHFPVVCLKIAFEQTVYFSAQMSMPKIMRTLFA